MNSRYRRQFRNASLLSKYFVSQRMIYVTRQVIIIYETLNVDRIFVGNTLYVFQEGICFVCLCLIFVNYVFLLLCLCILIVMYAQFCIFCFHRANWHSSATLTEVFPCFFLNCKTNARVYFYAVSSSLILV